MNFKKNDIITGIVFVTKTNDVVTKAYHSANSGLIV